LEKKKHKWIPASAGMTSFSYVTHKCHFEQIEKSQWKSPKKSPFGKGIFRGIFLNSLIE